MFFQKNKSNHSLDALIYLSKNVINKEIGILSQILSMYKRINFVHWFKYTTEERPCNERETQVIKV